MRPTNGLSLWPTGTDCTVRLGTNGSSHQMTLTPGQADLLAKWLANWRKTGKGDRLVLMQARDAKASA